MKYFFAALLLIRFCALQAQSAGTLQHISSTTGAACYEMEFRNNYLFAGAGNSVMVYDVNASTGAVGTLHAVQRLVSNVADMKFFGSHLVVAANHDGIYLMSTASLPNALIVEAHYLPDSTNEAAYNIALKGDSVFVAYRRKMAVFTIDTVNAQINLLARFGYLPSTLPDARVRGCDVKGNLLAYTVATYSTNAQADQYTGVYLINAAAAGFPQYAYHQQTFADPEDVIFGISTNLLHVLGGTESYANAFDPSGIFYSLDVSNPSNPQQTYSRVVGQGALPYIQVSQPMKAVNIHDTIYVAALGAPDSLNSTAPAYGHTYVFDARTVSGERLIQAVYAGLWHFDIAVNRKKMYVASEWYGIKTIDLTTMLSGGTDLGNTLTGGWCKGGDRKGNRLLQANEGYGFRVYDISSPSSPQLINANTTDEFCWGASYSGNGQYIYGHYYSVDDFRVFDAATLAPVGSVNQFSAFVDPRRSRSWGNKAVSIYHVGLSDNLVVVNAANPAAPVFELARPFGFDAIDIALDSAGNLFVMRPDSITVYDITGSTFPKKASIVVPGGTLSNFKTIAWYNDTIYAVVDQLLAASDGICKFYFNGTNQLTQIGSVLPLPVAAATEWPKFAAADSFGVYLVYQQNDMYALRKADMMPTGYYRHGRDFFRTTDYGPQDLYCKEGFVFLAEYFGQTSIFSNDTGFVLNREDAIVAQQDLSIFPNPSSGRFYVQVPKNISGQVKIAVYDPAGRCVRMAERLVSKGEDVLMLEVSDLPDGVYIFKMSSGEIPRTGKMILAH